MTEIFKRRKDFQKTAEHIKALGFVVIISRDPNLTYGYYSDGENIGYFQQNEFSEGVNVATCNKTPGSYGAHHILEPNNTPVSLGQLTKEYLKKGFADYPGYYTEEVRKSLPVLKWYNLRDFLSKQDPESLISV